MQSNKLRDIFTSKIFYVVFSFLAACALWFYVSINENPNMTERFSGITVEFSGQDVLIEKDLIVTDIDTESLTLDITGKRLDVARIKSEDIIATVDMAKITSAGIHQLEYEIECSPEIDMDDISITHASSNFVTVNVKKMITRSVEVRGTFDGEIAEGYVAGAFTMTPATVAISGPEDEISQIDCVRVVLARDTISKTVTDNLPFTVLDSDGQAIVSENITTDVDTIEVTQTVNMLKEVPLVVKCIDGAGAETGVNTTVSIEPSAVTLSGDAETLESINSIQLGTIDLTDFQLSYSTEMPIIIPDNIVNMTGIGKASVTVQVYNLVTTKISVSNISVKNQPEGYSTEIITKTLDITLRGSEADIDKITAENVRIVADLTDQSNAEGTFAINAAVYVDGYPNVGAIGTYQVNVRISKN